MKPRSGTTRSWPGILGVLIVLSSSWGTAWSAPAARPIFITASLTSPAVALGPRSLALEIDDAQIGALEAAGGGRVSLPLRDGRTWNLDLERFEILTPDAIVTSTGDDGAHAVRPDVRLFRGVIEGIPGSHAVISISPIGVLGTIQTGSERFEIAPIGEGAGRAPRFHVVADSRDLTQPGTPFECGTEAMEQAMRDRVVPERRETPRSTPASATRLRAELAVDCDYEYYAFKRGADLTSAISYALTVLGVVSDIYENDVNVEIGVSYLNVWTTTNDPYTMSTTSDQLPQFRDWWNANRGGVSRHLAHLISGRPLGGGIAFLSVLCNRNTAYGVSQVDGVYSYPTSTSTWDAYVLAHEMGHNFSSQHTQSCFWQSAGYTPPGTLLDYCYPAEGNCYTGPTGILPPGKGTIMSYCHQVAGVASGIRLEFHTACKTEIRLHSEACLPAAAFNAGLTLSGPVTNDIVNLSWNTSPAPGVLHYDVYRSPISLDLAPQLLGSTTGTVFADTAGTGTYFYRVVAVRASDQSGYSNEVMANVCLLVGPGFFGTSTQATTPVVADFNEDGIPDLAMTNGISTGVVYVLMGQGSGGVGNGTFASPVSYGVGRYPVDMITGDFNEDGITDLVSVSKLTAGGVTFLFGNGSGGVGDGTFADSLVIPVGQEPAALAAGDFNEDGIPDLAVAGFGNSRVSIMLGQGSNGHGNGTFVVVPTNGQVSTRPIAILTGDYNEDGIADLASLGSVGGQVSVLLGLGSGGTGIGEFAAPVNYGTEGANALVSGDWNSDGITDLAALTSDPAGSLKLLFGNGSAGVGNGTFGAPVVIPTGSPASDVAVGDLDGDGFADLALTNSSANTFSLLLGNASGGVPDGTFDPAVPFTVGTQPSALAIADFDEDGKPDVAMTHLANTQNVAVLSSTCAGRASLALAVTSPNGGENWGLVSEQTITWVKGPGVVSVNLEINRGDGRWEPLATNQTGTSFSWTVTEPQVDSAVVKVRVYDPAVASRSDESNAGFRIGPDVRLGVGSGPSSPLRLDRVYPNPSRGSLSVGFSLPQSGPATLEVIDISGRRVRSMGVGSFGLGSHVVRLEGREPLASGVYVVRLTQGGRSVVAKAAVLK